MKKLDETLRRRMQALAETEQSPLGNLERQRILARVRERAREGRSGAAPWLLLGAVAVGAAAIAYPIADDLFSGRDTVAEAGAANVDHIVATVPTGPMRTEGRPPAPAVAAPSAACASAPLPSVDETRAGGRRIVSLPGRARIVSYGRNVDLDVEPCATVITLGRRGRVVVHAEDLLGGELIVRTGDADIVVHGTVFDVRVADDQPVRVAVAEGTVGVRSEGRAEARVEAGQSLVRDADGDRVRDLHDWEIARMMRALQPSTEPVGSAAEAVDGETSTTRGEVREGVPMVHAPNWGRPR